MSRHGRASAGLLAVGVCFALWPLAGCSDDNADDAASTTSTTSGSGGAGGGSGGSGATATSSTAGTGGSAAMAGFRGSLKNSAGEPLVDAPIQLCALACYLGYTDTAGDFAYASVPAGHYKVDVRGPDDGNRYGAINFPIDLEADVMHQLDEPLYLPITGEGTVLSPGSQQVAVDGQLSITLDPANLTFPALAEPALAGVRVSLEQAPPNAPASGTAVAWWALNPFGTLASSPLPVSIVNDIGLAANADVAIYTVNDQTGELDLEASSQVSADGSTISLGSGAGLSQLSWLVVVVP